MGQGRPSGKWSRGTWCVAGLLWATLAACSGDEDAAGGPATTTTTTTTQAPATTQPPEPLGEAELQSTVADSWDAIWIRDWDALLGVYDTTCRTALTPDVFAATLGQGIDALEGGGIDPTETDVKVRVEDLVEGEFASVVSLLTFPGFAEVEEDDTGTWVVQDGSWRRNDCDDLLAAAGATTTDGASGDSDTSRGGVGSVDVPAAFGSVFEFEGWRGSVVDLVEAAPLLASFSGQPPEGQTFVMVVAELQYLGATFAEPNPFLVRAIDSGEYESFDNECALDGPTLAAQGISVLASAVPGELLTTGTCLSVPTDELSSVVFVLENAFAIADPEVYFSETGTAADRLPEAVLPSADPANGALAFGTSVPVGEEFTATVVSVLDGVAEGLVSEFVDPAPAGSTYGVVIWEGTYTGSDDVASDPFVADGIGSAVFDSLTSGCVLDQQAVASAHGVSQALELAPGETFRGATCWLIPTAELGSVVVQLDNVFDFDAAPVRFVQE